MGKGLLLFCLLCQFAASAQKLSPMASGSVFKFTIKNFGFLVQGQITGLKGEIIFDPAHLEAALFRVTLEAATVNTGNTSRDKHLVKEDYFNVAGNPNLYFQSSRVYFKSGTYFAEGDLTIKGITKRINFPFSAVDKGKEWFFSGQFKLNRREFRVGGYSPVLADELTVMIQLLGAK